MSDRPCIDIGRGDREYVEATKAVARLREILELGS